MTGFSRSLFVFAWACALFIGISAANPQSSNGPSAGSLATKQKVIIDTDIGDDIDDALAVGLALNSPELEVIGITSAWGDTKLRARLLDRLLRETDHGDIPVAIGIERHKEKEAAFSQAAWALREPAKPHQDAVDFLLQQIKKYPGEITLIAIGPETNLGAAIARDPATFRKLKRIVIMGGSVRLGYDDRAPLLSQPPVPEYNVVMDVPAAQAVFRSGIPLYIMPLDSTQLKLEERERQMIFTRSRPLTDAMTLLYHLWSRETKQVTPTMFDAVAVAYAIDPQQCPTTPLHLEIDAEGFTREKPGQPNSNVCLTSDTDSFFRFYLPRVLADTARPMPPAPLPN
ncbi:MAG: nucleoside hydrolase [Candidatus Acidiferrum sp.]